MAELSQSQVTNSDGWGGTLETGHTWSLAPWGLQFLPSTGSHPASWLKGNEHKRKHREEKWGTAPGSELGNVGTLGSREDGHKTVPIPVSTHPRKQSPQGTVWPLPWELSQSVRIIASLGTRGLMTGSGQALCI